MSDRKIKLSDLTPEQQAQWWRQWEFTLIAPSVVRISHADESDSISRLKGWRPDGVEKVSSDIVFDQMMIPVRGAWAIQCSGMETQHGVSYCDFCAAMDRWAWNAFNQTQEESPVEPPLDPTRARWEEGGYLPLIENGHAIIGAERLLVVARYFGHDTADNIKYLYLQWCAARPGQFTVTIDPPAGPYIKTLVRRDKGKEVEFSMKGLERFIAKGGATDFMLGFIEHGNGGQATFRHRTDYDMGGRDLDDERFHGSHAFLGLGRGVGIDFSPRGIGDFPDIQGWMKELPSGYLTQTQDPFVDSDKSYAFGVVKASIRLLKYPCEVGKWYVMSRTVDSLWWKIAEIPSYGTVVESEDEDED